MQNSKTAYIGLCSNLGDRQRSIRAALKMLGDTPEIKLDAATEPVETAPLGQLDQPKYLNAVARIATTLAPENLLKRLKEIETDLGRTEHEKWASRTIDLDLLLYEDQIIDLPELKVPHRQMHLRAFVLDGLCKLNDKLIHPVIDESITELADRLRGTDFVLEPALPQLVVIAGNIGVGKTTLAGNLSEMLNCPPILEAYDDNPFLADVYAGNKDLALDSQLYFLTSRLRQLAPATLEPGKIAVCDYVFEKELIYARQLLTDRQFALYEKIFQPLKVEVARPVLAIFLCDRPANCLERIHRRNRPYEQAIELDFLRQLDLQYVHLFDNWKTCPVIRLDMSSFDCTRNGDIRNLKKQIGSYVAGPWK